MGIAVELPENMSHPVWVRGLKYLFFINIKRIYYVAPRVGAWIEIDIVCDLLISQSVVAPRVGAWIEIVRKIVFPDFMRESHPVWVRGLKWVSKHLFYGQAQVAPRVGAWIEITLLLPICFGQGCRTPCGCVD